MNTRLLRSVALCALAGLLLQTRCNRDVQDIPYVPVDFTLNVNLPAYMNLNVPTGYVLVAGGSRGIVVYRYTTDTFVALDRHSTYDIAAGCQVQVSDDGIFLQDPDTCSTSQWYIFDGTVAEGPATLSLQRYYTSWNPPILRVYN